MADYKIGQILTSTEDVEIEKALSELNYTENKVARSLANGKTEIIGIIIPNLFLHYYSQILNNIFNSQRLFHLFGKIYG